MNLSGPHKYHTDATARALRQTVAAEQPNRSPMPCIDTPLARSLVISMSETFAVGRPSRFPFARAFRRPARTRSAIRDRSSSATAPRTVKIILPVGVEVSICSLYETNSIPKARNVSRARSRCDTDRAKRSNFQTHTTSNRRLWASAMSRFNSGRESLAPEIPSIHVLTGDCPAATVTVFPEFPKLHLGTLAVPNRAHSCIDCDPHFDTLSVFNRFLAHQLPNIAQVFTRVCASIFASILVSACQCDQSLLIRLRRSCTSGLASRFNLSGMFFSQSRSTNPKSFRASGVFDQCDRCWHLSEQNVFLLSASP